MDVGNTIQGGDVFVGVKILRWLKRKIGQQFGACKGRHGPKPSETGVRSIMQVKAAARGGSPDPS